jgi:hypothetical protein
MLEMLLAAALQLPRSDMETVGSLLKRMPSVTEKNAAAVRADLWVDEKGRVLDCTIVQAAGSPKTANVLCRKMVGLRFQPATDSTGKQTYSLFRTTLSAFDGDNYALRDKLTGELDASRPAPEVTVELESANASAVPANEADLRVLVGGDGRVTNCDHGEQLDGTLGSIACKRAMEYQFEVRYSKAKEPVAYVRTVKVDFEVKPGT